MGSTRNTHAAGWFLMAQREPLAVTASGVATGATGSGEPAVAGASDCEYSRASATAPVTASTHTVQAPRLFLSVVEMLTDHPSRSRLPSCSHTILALGSPSTCSVTALEATLLALASSTLASTAAGG